ncbi:hypothetical protein CCHOA_09070 [Corynebacterium choanae]|uniref:Uncharacterized protein n=1 Tax=Corynebacterium choanae TaxID=1862358 RepID=A0A3G6J812_9CORY|nr:hypothetical protein CCHOA_09070 [Corynebacterium choanae]
MAGNRSVPCSKEIRIRLFSLTSSITDPRDPCQGLAKCKLVAPTGNAECCTLQGEVPVILVQPTTTAGLSSGTETAVKLHAAVGSTHW